MGVYCEEFAEEWPCHKDSALYVAIDGLCIYPLIIFTTGASQRLRRKTKASNFIDVARNHVHCIAGVVMIAFQIDAGPLSEVFVKCLSFCLSVSIYPRYIW